MSLSVEPDVLWHDTYWEGSTPAMTTRWMRVLRGTTAASFATFIAAFSHVLGGGHLPHPAALAFIWALATLTCIALAGRTLSLVRTSLSVILSQAAFHAMFSAIGTPVTTTVSGHTEHGALLAVPPTAMHTMVDHSPWMWVAHAAAAVATIIALRHGEAAFWGMRDIALLFLGVLVSIPAPVALRPLPRAPRPGSTLTVTPRDLSVLFSALRHRGPPALAV